MKKKDKLGCCLLYIHNNNHINIFFFGYLLIFGKYIADKKLNYDIVEQIIIETLEDWKKRRLIKNIIFFNAEKLFIKDR